MLFARLLAHCAQTDAAESAGKRPWTYRWWTWWATRHGIPFRFSPAYPFNPLRRLRLAIAAGNAVESTERIFVGRWTIGVDPDDPRAPASVADTLGVDRARIASQEVEDVRCSAGTTRRPRAACSTCQRK